MLLFLFFFFYRFFSSFDQVHQLCISLPIWKHCSDALRDAIISFCLRHTWTSSFLLEDYTHRHLEVGISVEVYPEDPRVSLEGILSIVSIQLPSASSIFQFSDTLFCQMSFFLFYLRTSSHLIYVLLNVSTLSTLRFRRIKFELLKKTFFGSLNAPLNF